MKILRDILIYFILAALSAAQTKSAESEVRVFRNEDIGLTWTYPDTLVAEQTDKLPRDPSGRERIILALWDKTQKTPVPLIVFLWGTRVRPNTWSRSEIAQRYLRYLKSNPGKASNLSESTELQIGSRTAWKMVYSLTDKLGQSSDCEIALPLKNRTLLLIQMSARSASELDSFMKALATVKFDPQK